ncbi:3-oxoacyl-[acyl-carrier-protein] synthase III C-terminal domain-containing protein [Candidatus Uabimicrobium amorphum]|uniref:3-oxoacyl-ACP synthase n=1 Tax=Uabimicrobium amorphum TaxID=2596890 RepID=A0A5S9IK55_UABAM|nr:3-oxoacyl-[acyl-carrier-protein] synthase III C-terminal domain-containing protein [Candidatus Uabimicrobium amorphum]BBM82075.1 3-oxoacyl-ACP synthase [Candidatus Uabimicrobium amorphum]
MNTIRKVKISGIGRYLPQKIITNDYFQRYDIKADWILRKNGVRERRFIEEETNASMGAAAAKEACAEAQLAVEELDLIINASGTPQQAIPDTAPLLQQELGLGESGIPCMTVHTTCLSFLNGLDVASLYIDSGRYSRILVVSSEIASIGLNWQDPASCTLFGDLAAAVVVEKSDDTSQVCTTHFATYGVGAHYTEIRGCGTSYPPNAPHTKKEDSMFQMNGLRVLRMVKKHKTSFLEQLQAGLSTSLCDIDWVVPHQASYMGLKFLKSFGWPEEQIIHTLEHLGNCIAASIPATLYEGIRDKKIQRGDKVLLVGTGAGLSLGAVILRY